MRICEKNKITEAQSAAIILRMEVWKIGKSDKPSLTHLMFEL